MVVAGDLNKVGMKRCDFLKNVFHLTPVLKKGKSTHCDGWHLDNLWTNIDCTSVHLVEYLNHISDHTMLQVTLRIGGEIKRSLPYKEQAFNCQADVRKAISTNSDIKAILK